MRGQWRQLGFAALLLSVATAMGCQPTTRGPASEVKTLDNFAAGERVRTNSCAASPERKKAADFSEPMFSAPDGRIKVDPSITGAASDTLKADVREALTAVPPEMQVAFMAMGGFVDVTSKTKERCTRAFRGEGEQKTQDSELEYVTGCFEFRPLSALSEAELAELSLSQKDLVNADGSERKGSVFRINIMPESKEIKHAMVRAFGFVYAQVFARMSEATEEEKASSFAAKLRLNKTEGFKVANLKLRIAQNFLVDMIESKAFDLRTMENFLGEGAAGVVRANYERLKKRGNVQQAIDANFEGVPPAGPKFENEDLLAGVSYLYRGELTALSAEQKRIRMVRFVDFVFAEFFDSIKCHTFGNYPGPDVVQKVKEGKGDRNEFLKSAENTLRVVQDFFPNTYAMYAETEREMHALMVSVAQQSPFKSLLKGDAANGLGLADDPLAAFAQALGGQEQPNSQPKQFGTTQAGAKGAAGVTGKKPVVPPTPIAPVAPAVKPGGGMSGLLAQLGPLLSQVPKTPPGGGGGGGKQGLLGGGGGGGGDRGGGGGG